MKVLYKTPGQLFTKVAFTILVLLMSCGAYANHIVGADLFYTYISGNTYKITFVAYGDCGPASAGPFAQLPNARPQICVYNGATYVATVNLRIDTPANPYTGKEITPVCPADSANTQCTNPSYSIPGIKKFVYTGTYTMPSASHNWRFIFDGGMGATSAGRAAAITNIASGTIIQLIDSLDNTYHNNSSPALTIVPTPFFCLNSSDSYNPGAVDPEGDSMRFNLVAGTVGSNTCGSIGSSVTYTGGYTPTAPLAVTTGTLVFNNATGQINFFPNALQRSLVVYNVTEYRNDTFIGTSQREMTFLVLTCTTPPPTGSFSTSSAGVIVDSNHFSVCTGTGSYSVTLTPTEADTSKVIYVSTSGLPAGSSFVTINDSTNHPTCTFTWTTASVPVGSYTFFVTFKDNSCPVNGVRTNAYTITVAPLPNVDGGPMVTICAGSSTVLTATGAATYTWSPATGLSCTACASPTASPASTTLYTITGTSAVGCVSTDTVTVFVNPNPAGITGSSPICVGSTTTLSDATSGGTWSSSGSAIATVNPSTGVVTGVSAGTVNISYVLPTGCFQLFNFTVNPIPTAIGGPTQVCVGSTITETDGVTGGTWATSDVTVASIDATTGVTTGVGAGTVTITYALPAGCLVTRTITVNPLPAVITGTTTLCAGTVTSLSDATGAGTWTTSSAAIASVVSSTGVVYGVSAGTATISYTLGTGCYQTTTVTVNPLPAVIGGPTQVCVGSTITLTDGTAGGTWATTNASVASIDATGVVTGVAVGTVTISYTLATGCYKTTTVTVNPLPATIGGPTVVCVAASITLTNSSTGGTWTTSSATTASVAGSTGVVTGVSAGTVTITYTLPTTCYITTTVTVNPLPVAGTIGGLTTVCVGNTINMTETVTGGTWSSTNTSIATISATGVVTGVAAGTDTVKYSVTNSCGTAVATYVITVIAFPTAGTITGPTNVCENASVTFTDAISGGTWTSANTSIAVVTAGGVVTGVLAGTTTISYAVTNSCGTAYATKTIIVDPIPTITITPSAPDYCIGGTTPLVASGAVSYTWTPGTALTATTGSSIMANPTTTTTYTVTGVAANNCTNTNSVVVTVHPLPTITIPNVIICAGTTTVLTASGANTYVWSPAATLSSSTGNSLIASPTDTTTYTIVGTDIYGCVNSTTVTVDVNPIPPPPNVTTPVNYCLTATSVPLTAAGISLLWYNVATGGTGSATAPTPSTAAVGTFDYYVTQTVDYCESPRADIQVNILHNSITNFSYTINYGCTFDTVQFTNTSQYSSHYEWSFGDGSTLVDSNTNPVHYYLPAHVNTNYTVKLHGFNSLCFDDSTIQVLTLTPDPNPKKVITGITADQTILFGNSVQLDAEGAFIYYWKPDNGSLNNPNINNPIATPSVTTTYIVYGYDKTGCLDSAKVDITVDFNDADFIPSGFTPNGDGQNDVFRISHLKYGKLVEFSVYNRWGQRVFYTSDINKGWDGHFDGEPQDMGVYSYLVILSHTDGTNKVYKGTITLIR